MGQQHNPMGGPADAGRAFVASDRAYGLDPFGLQSLPPPRRRRCALRLPFAHHGLAVVCCAPGWAYGKAFQPRHGFAVARKWRSPPVRLAAHGGPRHGAGSAFSWPTAFRFALQSRPSLLSRSPAAGLDRRRCASPATCHASGQAVTISSPLRGRLRRSRYAGLRYPSRLGLRLPRCHVPLLQPETPPAPLRGRSLRGDPRGGSEGQNQAKGGEVWPRKPTAPPRQQQNRRALPRTPEDSPEGQSFRDLTFT